jgi:hypothetical protein
MSVKKYFTLEEANSHVPQLLQDIPLIQELARGLNKFPDVKKAWEKAKLNGGSNQGTAYLSVALKINNLVEGIESKGIILKGLVDGLVDFPAIREGKEVYLCWKIPEQKIEFWHDVDAGFKGRKPI